MPILMVPVKQIVILDYILVVVKEVVLNVINPVISAMEQDQPTVLAVMELNITIALILHVWPHAHRNSLQILQTIYVLLVTLPV